MAVLLNWVVFTLGFHGYGEKIDFCKDWFLGFVVLQLQGKVFGWVFVD